MSAIPCGHCGHENDLTRVFCQNCGNRLERSEAGPTLTKTTPVPVKQASRRQGPTLLAALRQFVRGLLSLIVLAAVLALLIQMARVPDGVPALQTGNVAAATQFEEAVRAFSSSPFRRTLDLKQDEVNNFLAMKLVPEPGSPLVASFERAFVVFGKGSGSFFVERRFAGLSVYFQVECEPVVGPGGADAVVKGGSIGRMPVHPRIFSLVQGRVITPTLDALADSLALLRKANRVEILPEVARFDWPGTPPKR